MRGKVAPAPRLPPAAAVAIAVASVSFAAPLFRLADAPAVTASFWRLAFAVAILAPFTRHAWPAWRAYTGRDWGVVVGAGLALALHFALWVTSLGLTTVAAATCLVTMQAVFVALGGHFLGDRLRAANVVGIAIALAGATLLALGDALGAGGLGGAFGSGGKAILGDILAVVAGLCSAIYMLVGRRLRATRGLVEYVTPVYASAALILLLAALVMGEALVAGLGTSSFVFFVLLAAVPMLGGHTMANWALRHLPAHTIATWILLEPVGASLLAALWPGIRETPGYWTIVGGLVVLAGAALTIPRGSRGAATEPAG